MKPMFTWFRTKCLLTTTCIFLCSVPRIAVCQTSYTIGAHSIMNLKGTSSVRNWAMSAQGITGNANFHLSPENELLDVTAFTIEVPVYNLRSKSKSLEKDAYKALKADTFPSIDFALTSAQFKPSGFEHYVILLHGNLTMAGVTQPITLKASAALLRNGSIVCTGSLPLTFSDYGMIRPSFLFGSMKVNDAMTLDFNLILVH